MYWYNADRQNKRKGERTSGSLPFHILEYGIQTKMKKLILLLTFVAACGTTENRKCLKTKVNYKMVNGVVLTEVECAKFAEPVTQTGETSDQVP